MPFEFNETMSGSYHLLDEPDVERPLSFTLRALSRALPRFLMRRDVAIEGSVDAEGLASGNRLTGTLGMDVLLTGKLPYAFTFLGNDGRRYRFSGEKTVTLLDLPEAMTVLPGSFFDAADREIARAIVRFDLRDLPSFLRSFSLVRR